jgi:hypothetical protein
VACEELSEYTLTEVSHDLALRVAPRKPLTDHRVVGDATLFRHRFEAFVFGNSTVCNRVVAHNMDEGDTIVICGAGPSLKERVATLTAEAKPRVLALYATAMQRLKPLVAAISDKVAASGIGDIPLKIVGLAIGILLILLLVVAGVSQCGRTPSGDGNDEIILAVPMPEPYFDE